ncbi:Spindle and kinetochore-associated protein [Ananas comosus]|uniref:Spindle and kinetochore-associated protein n=1 Tax=Ananas comosus TaxID=4615 RepID=A0A199VP96_ANACO|nr:Spindle and kinetochore-associated protein [Ananas comosus]
MDPKHAGSALDDLVSSFTIRIAELQELVIARNMYPATTIPDLSAVDATLKAMESQIEAIKGRLQEEKNAIPKAKRLVEQSQRQQRKLQHMLAHVPAAMVESLTLVDRNPSSAILEVSDCDVAYEASKQREEPVAAPKKGRGSAPRWYISAVELDSLSSYMRGRLTLEKVNIAINEVATYADANAHLISCPKKKELRDIAMAEPVKGKHFFLEADIKGPGLKLDNTGKAILTRLIVFPLKLLCDSLLMI